MLLIEHWLIVEPHRHQTPQHVVVKQILVDRLAQMTDAVQTQSIREPVIESLGTSRFAWVVRKLKEQGMQRLVVDRLIHADQPAPMIEDARIVLTVELEIA
jgi:hypothetical protein